MVSLGVSLKVKLKNSTFFSDCLPILRKVIKN